MLILYTTPVTNHQTVAAAVLADSESARIRPSRIRPRYCHAVVGRVWEGADNAIDIQHTCTITDHKAVAATLKADVEITRIRPSRSHSCHRHNIVGGVGFGADITILIRNTCPVANHQTITTAIIAHVKSTTIGPSRVRSRHQHTVVGGFFSIADKSGKINHTSLTTDHQAVATTKIADIDIPRIAPGRACSRHQYAVIG